MRLYSTVLGGAMKDQITDVNVNSTGLLFASGSNYSTEDFPVQGMAGAYYLPEAPGNGMAMSYFSRFIAATGQKQWCSYISSCSGINFVDDNFPITRGHTVDDTYLCGSGNSLQGIPQAGGGYHNENGDGFIMEFNGDMQLIYSTRFGQASTTIKDAQSDSQGRLIICGRMRNSTQEQFPRFSNNGEWLQEDCGGQYFNGYFTVFDSEKNIQWSTYFGGNGTYDDVRSIGTYNGGFYICGLADSDAGFPLQEPTETGQYFDDTVSDKDGFIAQFHEGQLVWSTYFGGSGNDMMKDVLARSQYEVYVTGRTISSDWELQTAIDAYNQSEMNNDAGINNKWDSFLISFNNKYLLWNTFIGGTRGEYEHSETGRELTIIEGSKLIVTGSADSDMLFPWWDFDGEDFDVSWFDDFATGASGDSDGWIARIDIEDISTAVDELNGLENSGLIVFPNPTTDLLHFLVKQIMDLKISVYDQQGRLCLTQSNPNFTGRLFTLDCSSLAEGAYHLSLTVGEQIFQSNFIKQ